MEAEGRSHLAGALGLVLLLSVSCRSRPELAAELAFVGGTVYTAVAERPFAEALAVRGQRIAAVGSTPEVEVLVTDDTRVVDLAGRLLLPGFVDGFLHLQKGAASLAGPPVSEAESYEELLEIVRVHARSRAGDDWIVGFGLRYRALGRSASRADLDQAVQGRPALFLCQDGAAAFASSKALELAGLSPDSPPVLREVLHIAEVEGVVPPDSFGERRRLLEDAIRFTHRFGITGIHLPGESSYVHGALASRIHAIPALPPRKVTRIHPSKISSDWMPVPRRPEHRYPLKSLSRSGELLVFGSDWPFGPIDPLVGIAAAVTREDLDGKPQGGYLPEERLTVEEAVLAYTRNGAYASSEEHLRGTLEVGKLADLAVLSEDPFKIPPRRIAELRVEMTVLGGRIVYAARK